MELGLYFITLLASLFLGVEYGILIGIACNIILLLYTSARPPVLITRQHVACKDVVMVKLTQNLHFPAAEYFRHRIADTSDKNLDVIIDGTHVMHIDTTVAKNIKILVTDLKARDQMVVLWNFQPGVKSCCVNFDGNLEKYFMEGELENIIKKFIVPEIEIQR